MNEEHGCECGRERASRERSEEFEGLKEHTDGIEQKLDDISRRIHEGFYTR